MLFEDIIGNNHLKKYLTHVLEKNLLGNTLLFSGIDGVGKSLFAKALAFHLLEISEEDKKSNKPHPDLHILKPEGKTFLHSLSSIKEMIDKVFMAPFQAKVKLFIIEEAHRMLPSSSNALLKTLEEPILDSYIILITDKETELLPTITSRCIKLKFSPLTDGEIVSLLQRWGKTSFESKKIASLAQGSVSRACEIANFVEDDDITKILIDILSKKGIKSYLDLSPQLDALQAIFDKEEAEENSEIDKEDSKPSFKNKFRSIEILFSHIFMWYRDLHLYKNNISPEYLFYVDKIDYIKKASEEDILPLDLLDKYLSEATLALDRNTKIKTCLENLFVKLNVI